MNQWGVAFKDTVVLGGSLVSSLGVSVMRSELDLPCALNALVPGGMSASQLQETAYVS